MDSSVSIGRSVLAALGIVVLYAMVFLAWRIAQPEEVAPLDRRLAAEHLEPYEHAERVPQSSSVTAVSEGGKSEVEQVAETEPVAAAHRKIRGAVRFIDGRPCPRVRVAWSAWGAAGGELASDRLGRFEVEVPVELERVSFELADADFAQVRGGAFSANHPAVEPLVIVAPRRELWVEVRYDDGEPVEGAGVGVEVPGSSIPQLLLGTRAAIVVARTDAHGRALVAPVPAIESLELTVLPDLPGARGLRRLVTLVETGPVTVVLERPRPTRRRVVSGVVVGPGAELVRGARVGLGRVSAATDGHGVFELAPDVQDLATDPMLYAYERGFGAAIVLDFGVALLASGEERVDVRLTLEAALEISGRVRWSDGEPCAGARVSPADATALASNTHPPPTIEASLAGSNWVGTGPDGSFVLGGLARREYRLLVEDRAVLLRHVTHPIAAGSRDVDVVLDERARPGPVRGRVTDQDGAPVQGALVRARALDADFAGIRSYVEGPGVLTDEEGRFELEGIAPLGAVLTIESPRTMPLELAVGKLQGSGLIVLPHALPTAIEWTGVEEHPDRIAFLDSEGEPLPSMLREGASTTYGERLPFPARSRRTVVEVHGNAVEAVFFREGREIARVPYRGRPGARNRLLAP